MLEERLRCRKSGFDADFSSVQRERSSYLSTRNVRAAPIRGPHRFGERRVSARRVLLSWAVPRRDIAQHRTTNLGVPCPYFGGHVLHLEHSLQHG
jgi:hypothetical protein